MQCKNCGTENPFDAQYCSGCGAKFDAESLTGSVVVPPPPSAPGTPPAQGDATGGVIPYKNPQALIAYYLGLFSFFPVLGLPLGVAAVILGILGLRKRRQTPAIKGQVHAWIGIGCGGLFTLVWAGLLIAGLIGAFQQ